MWNNDSISKLTPITLSVDVNVGISSDCKNNTFLERSVSYKSIYTKASFLT